MSKTRKQYTKALKFKVAIEMIKGNKSIAELIKEYGVNQSVLQKWKKQLVDSGANIFDGHVKMDDQSQQAEIDRYCDWGQEFFYKFFLFLFPRNASLRYSA